MFKHIFTIMIEELLNDIGVRVTDKVKETLKTQGLVTSDLYKSLDYTISDNNGLYLLEFKIPEYGLYIDKGRKKGARMPPSKPIEDWMKKNNIPSRASFAIRRSISIRGIKPRPFLDVYDKELENISEEILKGETIEISLTLDEILNRLK